MRNKVALISGISGQDGSYLAEFLLSRGYEVHGIVRRSSSFETWWRLDGIRDKLTLHYGDMTDPFSLMWALKKSQPDEVYNLAAQSHVAVSWETPWYTAQTSGIGVLNLLEAIRVLGMTPKIYQASTSELFSGTEDGPQNEETIKDPVSPYGTAKLYGFQIAKNYRGAYGMFICNGILFNHESPRRGDNFVTKKIINAAKARETVKLGNLEASRDWGSADEYMRAAWLMLQQDTPDDYVIATGKTYTVKDFLDFTAKRSGTYVDREVDPQYIRPHDVPKLHGDASKARTVLGWEPKRTIHELIDWMLGTGL
jgi:GDPmannose 4,6-dehydratase